MENNKIRFPGVKGQLVSFKPTANLLQFIINNFFQFMKIFMRVKYASVIREQTEM
jgi:hypothetical protein